MSDTREPGRLLTIAQAAEPSVPGRKPYVSYGPGHCGAHDTEEEARARVAACGGEGGVYRLLPGPDYCEHGVPDFEFCAACNREYKRARAENGLDPED